MTKIFRKRYKIEEAIEVKDWNFSLEYRNGYVTAGFKEYAVCYEELFEIEAKYLPLLIRNLQTLLKEIGAENDK